MISWLARLFRRKQSPVRGPLRPGPVSLGRPPIPERDDRRRPAARARAIQNLDTEELSRTTLEAREEQLLQRIGARIEAGDFELPQIPATSLSVLRMASNPGIEIDSVVETIRADPVLSSELLKTANSVVFAGSAAAETLRDAVMRLGMRSLRSMILTLSMRGVILRNKAILRHAEGVWRQAFSVANIARTIAGRMKADEEKAYLLALIHDIGKVALLSILSKELERASHMSSALVGRVFLDFHERAGIAMARAWKLSKEMISVAGCHHRFRENPDYPKSAALVHLAHKMDLFLSMSADAEYSALRRDDAMDALGIDPGERAQLLGDVERGFRASGRQAA